MDKMDKTKEIVDGVLNDGAKAAIMGAGIGDAGLDPDQQTLLNAVTDAVDKKVKEAFEKYMKQYQSQQNKYTEVFMDFHKDDVKNNYAFVPSTKGIRMARMAKLAMLSQNDPDKARKLCLGLYPDDKELQAYLNVTEKAMNVSTPSEGGFFVPEVLSNEVIPYLYPKLAVMSLGAKRVPMPNGNMTISRIDTTATMYWIGESKPPTKSGQTIGNVKLSSKKGACLVPVTNDLLRCNSVEADALIRDDMITVMKLGLDYAAMFGTGTQYTPRGINALSGKVSGSPSSHAQITSTDPGRLLALLLKQNVPDENVGWIMNADMWGQLITLKDNVGSFIFMNEMMINKTLMSKPYRISNQIPTSTASYKPTTLFLGDFSEFLWGEQLGMEVMLSKEASYTESGSQVSSFERDESVMRILTIVDFAARHDNSFVVSTFDTSAT